MKTCPSTVSLAKTRLLFFCVVLFVAIFSVPGQCPTNNKLPICTNVLMNKGLAQMNVMKFSCVASWARLHLRQSNYFSCLHNLHQSLIPYVNCNCPANAFVFYKSYLKKKTSEKKMEIPSPLFYLLCVPQIALRFCLQIRSFWMASPTVYTLSLWSHLRISSLFLCLFSSPEINQGLF